MPASIAFFHQNEVVGVQGGIERYLSTLLEVGKERCVLITERTNETGDRRFGVPLYGPKWAPKWIRFVFGVWKNTSAIRACLRKQQVVAMEFSRPEYVLFSAMFRGKKVFTIHGTGPSPSEWGKLVPHRLCCLLLPFMADRVQIVGRDSSGLPAFVRSLMKSRIDYIDAWYDGCFTATPFPDVSGKIGIFYAGRLAPMKNPDLIFSIAEALAKSSVVDARFYYFGADGEKIPSHLRGTAITDGGLLNAPCLAAAIANCHIGILCSGYGEGSPFIVVEVLACGRGYILPPLPGLTATYKNQEGVQFAEEYSADAYVKQIEYMLARIRNGQLAHTGISEGVSHRAADVYAATSINRLLD